jgi:hypothetical protein
MNHELQRHPPLRNIQPRILQPLRIICNRGDDTSTLAGGGEDDFARLGRRRIESVDVVQPRAVGAFARVPVAIGPRGDVAQVRAAGVVEERLRARNGAREKVLLRHQRHGRVAESAPGGSCGGEDEGEREEIHGACCNHSRRERRLFKRMAYLVQAVNCE